MNMLIGYNGSEAAKKALALAREHALIFDAKVYVLVSMEGGTGENMNDIAKAEGHMAYARTFLEESKIACECHQMVRGMTPGEDLVRFAEDNDIDQIFVGIEKKSRTQKLLMGSTAQFVILKAPCAVVTVK